MSIFDNKNAQSIASELATMTLAEALAMAQKFEAAAASFYRDLAGRVPDATSPLVHDLADEEERHGHLIQALAADPELALHLHQRIEAPASTDAFQSFVNLLSLPEKPYEDDILAYAQAREEIAREHYGYLAELAAPGPVQDLFLFLKLEEQRHADHLSERWGELFSIV